MAKKAKKQEPEFVEIEIDLDEVRRKVGFDWAKWLWHQWRWSRAHYKMTFEEYRERYIVAAIEERVWIDSPKIITACTDGTTRLEII